MKCRFAMDKKGNNMDWRSNIYSILKNTSIFQINAKHPSVFCHGNSGFLHASQM
jgi:hypothetical protein